MEKEQIISFAANIISNGIDTKLSVEKIKEGLARYFDYLKSQGYADNDTFGILNNIDATLPELIKLAQVYGSNGIINLMLNKPLQKEANDVVSPNHISVPVGSFKTDRCGNIVTDRCGNPMPKEQKVPATDRCGNPIKSDRCGTSIVSSNSCGGGRSMGRSSC